MNKMFMETINVYQTKFDYYKIIIIILRWKNQRGFGCKFWDVYGFGKGLHIFSRSIDYL